jgi:GxxExxY protein
MDIEAAAAEIVDAALAIHRAAGPGMLESAYEALLAYELTDRGLHVQRQKYISISYRGLHVKRAYCIDLLVNDAIIIEVKSVEAISPVHIKQVLTYLKLTGLQIGFLLNFGQMTLKGGGIRRLTNSRGPLAVEK